MDKPALRQLVTNNRWELLFKELSRQAATQEDKEWSNNISLLESRYNQAKQDYTVKGMIDSGTYDRELNKLRQALIQVIDELPNSTTAAQQATPTEETRIPPIPPPQYKWLLWVSLGLAAVILILTFLIPCPTTTQFWVFRTLLAIAAAGLTAALPGTFNLNLSNTITATGALAVFAALYFLNPTKNLATGDCDNKAPFNYTVFVHGKGGKDDKILRGQGKVKLYLNSLPLASDIDANGRAVFSEVATTFLNQKVRVEIEHPQPYKLTHPDSSLLLTNNGVAYVEVSLTGTNKIFGTVTDDKTNAYLDSVRVSILDIEAYTNKNGWFTLNIPDDKQAKFQHVVFDKKGYTRLSYDSIPVHTQQAFNVSMKRSR